MNGVTSIGGLGRRAPRRGPGSRSVRVAGAFIAAAAIAVAGAVSATAKSDDNRNDKLNKVQHIVVIYEENHSFDNLYGGWEGVIGRSNADPAHTLQVGQSGTPYTCLQQNDVNLTSPPLSSTLQ